MTDVSTEFDKATQAVMTDEDIERDRLQLGIDLASRTQEYFSVATPENIRNFAASYGDENPLFADPHYGESTRWGGQIAPPIFPAVVNAPLKGDKMDPEIKQAVKGVYRGIHAFVSGGTWDFYRPLRPGDTVFSYEGLESVEMRPSKFADRAAYRTTRLVKFNQNGDILGVYRILSILAERKKARDKGKYSVIEPASYTDEDIAKIDALYEAEQARGAETRWFEDVADGEELPAMVKGPLTVTDMIVFHAGGYGFAPYGLKTGKPNYRNRQRIAPFYIKNEMGVPDVAQRVHWDPEWARAIGNPMAYDYGVLRDCWTHHYLTNWVGDDGWVVRQETSMRKFNYMGDTQYFSGKVVRRHVENGQCLVDLEIQADNQRGDTTVVATATVALPSREHGIVVLPEPPDELKRKAQEILARHAELTR